MNGLPFQSVEYRQYKNTFLTRVLLSLDYDTPASVADEELLSRLKNFAEAYFQLEIGKCSDSFRNVQFTRNDGAQVFMLSRHNAAVILDGTKYVSYTDTAQPQLEKLCDFVEKVIGIGKVRSLGIRKINMWQFKNDLGTPYPAEKAREFVLQESIRNVLSSKNLLYEERRIPEFVKKEWQNECDRLVLRSAYFLDSKAYGVSRLVLDTARIVERDVSVKEIPAVAKVMNKDLYDAYFGCVNADIVKIMEGLENGAK